MRKLKLKEIITPEFDEAFSILYQQNLPAPVAFKLAGIADELKDYRIQFESVRERLLTRHCEKDDSGELKKTPDGNQYLLANQPEFDKQYRELINTEITLNTIKLKDIAKLQFTPPVAAVLARTVILA